VIAIIDYGMGNIRSLLNAINYIGYDVLVTSEYKKIREAERIVLPGVGAFGDAMTAIHQRGLDEILAVEVLEKGKPMLGICLGLQLLGKSSEEHGYYEGLGWIDAKVIRFNSDLQIKIPHIGWNEIDYEESFPLFLGLKKEERTFYFVHSYYMECNDSRDILATCRYGIEFAAVIKHDNFFATQFHPEKSQDNGIQVLQNFLQWTP
jgi:glutamine amidotransferase